MSGSAYQSLETKFKLLSDLADAEEILNWDGAAMMPSGGAASRGDQLAALRGVKHDILTTEAMADLFEEALGENLSVEQTANLGEMQRLGRHATALDADLVTAFSKACSTCETVWRDARAKDDFHAVAPYLEEVLRLVRHVSVAKAERLGLSAYDALLDEYEPDGRSAVIDHVFADLEEFLPGFVDDALRAQTRRPEPLKPEGPFAAETQRAVALTFMETLGFDFDHGRLDVSLHPFCGGTPDDVRITTRYDAADFLTGLFGVLHETGHALYEQGLPSAWRGQPAGLARGMSLHESQSLLMEMQTCRSKAFIDHAAPILAARYAGEGALWEADNLYRIVTTVSPGFIRVDADEATYPAHVILRYRLEKALIEGTMEIADLPSAWNDGMQRLLGITPPSDREGCLQDIHWYDGAWGYFPTYTLGAISAAQIFRAAVDADPDIPDGISKGDFKPLLSWLRTHIHAKGSLYSTEEILTQATGRGLDVSAFKDHLRSRYLD